MTQQHHLPLWLHITLTIIISLVWWSVMLTWWPWDWRGRRKDIKLNTRRKDWEDEE